MRQSTWLEDDAGTLERGGRAPWGRRFRLRTTTPLLLAPSTRAPAGAAPGGAPGAFPLRRGDGDQTGGAPAASSRRARPAAGGDDEGRVPGCGAAAGRSSPPSLPGGSGDVRRGSGRAGQDEAGDRSGLPRRRGLGRVGRGAPPAGRHARPPPVRGAVAAAQDFRGGSRRAVDLSLAIK